MARRVDAPHRGIQRRKEHVGLEDLLAAASVDRRVESPFCPGRVGLMAEYCILP